MKPDSQDFSRQRKMLWKTLHRNVEILYGRLRLKEIHEYQFLSFALIYKMNLAYE